MKLRMLNAVMLLLFALFTLIVGPVLATVEEPVKPDTLGTVFGVLVVLGFAYFIYTRIKKRQNRPGGSGSGGGGGKNLPKKSKK